MELQGFLGSAWEGYVSLTPDAPSIHRLLTERGERIVNDHVALRSFNAPGIGRLDLGRLFEPWGYSPAEDLDFPEKKLKATYYLHPDPDFPKVFVSELLVEQFSPEMQDWVGNLARQAAARFPRPAASIMLELPWDPVRFEDYQRFYPESEYAAWTAAFGLRVNHFTVLVNALGSFRSLEGLNQFLMDQGIELNSAGGLIKGTPAEGLEQSSTQARQVRWKFADGREELIPGCYYEFARRYPLPGSNELFPGFVPASANRIFESTFEKK